MIVPPNKTLIIEPNVTLLFAPNTNLIVDGSLIANGSLDKRIRLSSNLNLTNSYLSVNSSASKDFELSNGVLVFKKNGYVSFPLCLASNNYNEAEMVMKIACRSFGYRQGKVKNIIKTVDYSYVPFAEDCKESRFNYFDTSFDIYYICRINYYQLWYWNVKYCFQLEIECSSSFLENWGALKINSQSSNSILSYVDIENNGYSKTNNINGSLYIEKQAKLEINNIKISNSATNGLVLANLNSTLDSFSFYNNEQAAIYLSRKYQKSLNDSARLTLKNCVFDSNNIGVSLIFLVGQIQIFNSSFNNNKLGISFNNRPEHNDDCTLSYDYQFGFFLNCEPFGIIQKNLNIFMDRIEFRLNELDINIPADDFYYHYLYYIRFYASLNLFISNSIFSLNKRVNLIKEIVGVTQIQDSSFIDNSKNIIMAIKKNEYSYKTKTNISIENSYFINASNGSLIFDESDKDSYQIKLINNYFSQISPTVLNFSLSYLKNVNIINNTFVRNNANNVLYVLFNEEIGKEQFLFIVGNNFENNYSPSLADDLRLKFVNYLKNDFRIFDAVLNVNLNQIKLADDFNTSSNFVVKLNKFNDFLNNKYEVGFKFLKNDYTNLKQNKKLDLSENYWRNRSVNQIFEAIYQNPYFRKDVFQLNSYFADSEMKNLVAFSNMSEIKGSFILTEREFYGVIEDKNVSLVSGQTYLVKESIIINKNAYLKIMPNVTLLFNPFTKLIVYGKLHITGTNTQPVKLKINEQFQSSIVFEQNLRINSNNSILEAYKEQKWVPVCANAVQKKSDLELICKFMGFESFVSNDILNATLFNEQVI
jgi:hypothetical protein